jgi:hypothetical protein
MPCAHSIQASLSKSPFATGFTGVTVVVPEDEVNLLLEILPPDFIQAIIAIDRDEAEVEW